MTRWGLDVELPGYQQATIPLPDEPTYALEPVGSLVATVVRRNAPRLGKAVVYVHGWNDYFYQRHLADEITELGYDFYAVDLRRYGRSLRHGQLAGYIAELDHYFTELDAAIEVVRHDGHEEVVLMGHSTGGLVAVLYADARPGTFKALVLNSPWLELQGNALLRPALKPMVGAARRVAPTTSFSVPDLGFYERCISSRREGEWDYNPNFKGDPAFLVRMGWMDAILRGHARVEAGLSIDCPVLVATSKRTDFRRTWDESMRGADLILDVERIVSRAHRLGDLVVIARIEGGMHDLVLSGEPVRRALFGRIAQFLCTYA